MIVDITIMKQEKLSTYWIDRHIRPENNLFTCPITVNIKG